MPRKKVTTTTTVVTEILEGDGGAPARVHIVLDRSGSMSSCLNATISSINEYLGSLDPLARVSMHLFDSDGVWNASRISLQTLCDGVPAKNAPRLNTQNYQPRGGTPLYDAIGQVVSAISSPDNREVVVVLTDGHENTSKEWNQHSVKSLLENRQDRGWMVIYLGANQDALKEGAKFGARAHNTMTFDTANVGMGLAAVARGTSLYSSGASAEVAGFTAEEREKAVDKKARR